MNDTHDFLSHLPAVLAQVDAGKDGFVDRLLAYVAPAHTGSGSARPRTSC